MQPVGKRLIGISSARKTGAEVAGGKVTLTKFQESAWKCFAYTCLTILSGIALAPETYWHDTQQFWAECTQVPCQFESSQAMLVAYSADMAYYSYAIFYCLFFETKRDDWWATFAHHLVTVALIGYSFALGFTRAGVVIMFLHDISDPFLELAKMARYSKTEFFSTVWFVLFTLSWIAMRVVYFPVWVIWSVMFETWGTIVGDKIPPRFPHWELFVGMLVVLWALHVFWTYTILKIAIGALTGGTVDDPREDAKED